MNSNRTAGTGTALLVLATLLSVVALAPIIRSEEPGGAAPVGSTASSETDETAAPSLVDANGGATPEPEKEAPAVAAEPAPENSPAPAPAATAAPVAMPNAATSNAAAKANAATNSFIAESISQVVQAEIAHSLEGSYEDLKDWGKKSKVVDGLSIKGQGLNLKFRAHKKEVNNGLWKAYRVTLVDPARQLHVRVENLRNLAPSRIAFELSVAALLDGEARMERWIEGVKTLNISADANCAVEARLDCEVGFRFAPGSLLADLLIEPHINAVHLKLVRFDLKRVSKIGGTAAHELGDSLKGAIAHELQKREPKIAEKLNASLEKRKDSLRLSPQKMLTSGFSKVQGLWKAGDSDDPASPVAGGK